MLEIGSKQKPDFFNMKYGVIKTAVDKVNKSPWL